MHDEVNDEPRLALLIDADNISAKYLPVILNEIPRYGVATYRRIYGDFTDPQAAKWRPKLLDNSITPVQQFSNVKSHKPGEKAGKNATDSTLIIDAMDILYAGKVDGFVIVSSDSDFTRLAARLRESNMIVVGMGRNQTAISFRHACTKFVNIEYLYKLQRSKNGDDADVETDDIEEIEEQSPIDEENIETTVSLRDVGAVMGGIIHTNDNRGRTTSLAEVGAALNNKFPDFDVRNFGYSQLSKLIEDFDRFELVKTNVGYDVRIADTRDDIKQVEQFMVLEIGRHKNKSMSITSLASKMHDTFPHFNVKDTGYSQFYKFVDSIKGIHVTGGKRKYAHLD